VFSESVEVRRGGLGIAESAEPIGAQSIDGDEKEVGALQTTRQIIRRVNRIRSRRAGDEPGGKDNQRSDTGAA
jgi:hypothetical protein